MPVPHTGQECLCLGYLRNQFRTKYIRSFADFLLERLRFQ
jgi:hypothetical protein